MLRSSSSPGALTHLADSPLEFDPLVMALLLGLGALVIVQSGRLWIARNRARWRLAKHRQQGALGEQRAERLLLDDGYEILSRQAVARYELFVDDRPHEVTVRADFLVRRHGTQYVAEAKSGELASRIETAATRRQLLEYCLAFQADGVLLVDTHRQRIVTVRKQPFSATRPWRPPFLRSLLLAAVVALCSWYLLSEEAPLCGNDSSEAQPPEATARASSSR